MRLLRLLLTVLLASLTIVVIPASPSFACSCARASTEQYVDGADAVFTGTVTGKEPPPERAVMSSMDPITYTFDVERWFKGERENPVEILSAMSGASCGLEGVRAGQRYVVFASESRRGDRELWASLCGGTAPWSADLESDVAAAAGPGVVEPPSPAPVGGGTSDAPVDAPVDAPADAPADAEGPADAGVEEAEGGFLAVPVAAASGLGLVLLAGALWMRLLLRR